MKKQNFMMKLNTTVKATKVKDITDEEDQELMFTRLVMEDRNI